MGVDRPGHSGDMNASLGYNFTFDGVNFYRYLLLERRACASSMLIEIFAFIRNHVLLVEYFYTNIISQLTENHQS